MIELRWVQFGILPDMKRLEYRWLEASAYKIGEWVPLGSWQEVPTIIQDTLGKADAEA